MDFDQSFFENSFTNITFCHCCVWENWNWMWKIVVLDYFEVGDSTAGLFCCGDFGTGLFCCGRFYCWTFFLWEILMLDFLASGQMNRQAGFFIQPLDIYRQIQDNLSAICSTNKIDPYIFLHCHKMSGLWDLMDLDM